MTIFVLKNIGALPDPLRALDNYRELAGNYDTTCTHIEELRRRAVQALQLQPGETVFDIACGTGPTLPLLATEVGPAGSVVGVEMSPEMAAQARQRIAPLGLGAQVSVAETAVHSFAPAQQADAVLMCYAHDVLQCAASVDRLIAACKPGARIAITGMKTLPWIWGWPVNVFNLFRARRYLTTYANMDCPWRLLASRGANLQHIHVALWGSAYVVAGILPLEAS
jgi:SAM-dependent methyltransferase